MFYLLDMGNLLRGKREGGSGVVGGKLKIEILKLTKSME